MGFAIIAGPIACELIVKTRTGAKGWIVMILLGLLMLLLVSAGCLAGATLVINGQTNLWAAMSGAALLILVVMSSYAMWFAGWHGKHLDRENGKSPFIIRPAGYADSKTVPQVGAHLDIKV
jgi:hypothetical protein